MDKRQDGFTIIEVLLFLGISGLLLMGALIGVNNSINSTRFTDSVNSTVSFLQREYAAVANGQNARLDNLQCNAASADVTSGTSVPGMSNCVVLGRLVEFTVGGSALSSRYIVGRDTATAATNDTAAVLLASPKVVSQAELRNTFDVPWSMEINRMTRGAVTVNNLAFIKSPISERILIYSFPGTGITQLDSNLLRDTGTGNTLNQSVSACLTDGAGRVGFISIGTGQGQDVIRSDLSSTARTCP